MATYIALLKWTPQGLQNLKESPSRLDAARKKLRGRRREDEGFLHGYGTL
jgi:uncharacterized protein with GYD domain